MPHFFTTLQGNLLIRLLLAHLAADFILQTQQMVLQKKWFSRPMGIHIALVLGLSGLFSGNWLVAISIAALHWAIDGAKITALHRYPKKQYELFLADQSLHLLSILAVWAVCTHTTLAIGTAVTGMFTNYAISLVLLGYVVVIWPVGYLLKFALQKISTPEPTEQVQQGGKMIGRFERIIILTFVLLGQYRHRVFNHR